ncbi:MAG: FprA family A-type flavoprotein [Bacteroidetes bacterium]|nr:FprA family A-type flavoprotein [Bacteroidota bacterium]
MKAVKLKNNIYWVGAIDWDSRNFHGYLTQRGITYNAYLIIDKKITLIDTVKEQFSDEMIKRISSVIDPSKIDYIVSNHVEMDHSGSIPKMMDIAKNAELITCPNGEKGLTAHYKRDFNHRIVKTGDVLNLGKRNLQFVLTPMVHWPDNMVEYMPEEKILFSNDSFGQHYASSSRMDYKNSKDIIIEEAKKYFANIVLPYSAQVRKELEVAATLDIEVIASSHGIVWEKYTKDIIAEYKKWASNSVIRKAVIIYDTMWHSTEKMAYSIQEVFEEKGYSTSMKNLQSNHISDIMTELIDAEYICVGSPTLNNNIMPNVASFLTYLKGLSPRDRKAIAFGSFGWGGQSVAQVADYLKDSGFDVINTYKQKYVPSDDDLINLKNKLTEDLASN